MPFLAIPPQNGVDFLFRVCRNGVSKESRRQNAHFGVPGTHNRGIFIDHAHNILDHCSCSKSLAAYPLLMYLHPTKEQG